MTVPVDVNLAVNPYRNARIEPGGKRTQATVVAWAPNIEYRSYEPVFTITAHDADAVFPKARRARRKFRRAFRIAIAAAKEKLDRRFAQDFNDAMRRPAF